MRRPLDPPRRAPATAAPPVERAVVGPVKPRGDVARARRPSPTAFTRMHGPRAEREPLGTPERAIVGPVKVRGRPPSDPGNRTPTTTQQRAPLVRRAWNWLLAEGDGEEERRKPAAAATKQNRKDKKKHKKKDKAPSAPVLAVSRLLAKWRDSGKDGEKTPHANHSGLRGQLTAFLRSKRRAVTYARTTLFVAIILLSSWSVVLATTGFNLVDAVFAPVDEDDVSTLLRTPFFVVESGSLMQRNQPFGRMKTIDPGDIVVVERIDSRDDVQTFYGTGDRFVANGRGDVIVFLPVATPSNPNPPPIVHRAVAYLERNVVPVPNPDAGPGRPATVQSPRFTVAEFGVYDARSVTIPELGLYNYQPDRSGFLTRGDNPRTNNWADQALGVTVFPVPEDRVLGRVKYMIPYMGLAKLALVGQDPMMISPDGAWCSFLAGKAPCDNWVVFLVIVAVFIGTPFGITLYLFTRRVLERRRERQEIQRQQEAALARQRAEAAKEAALRTDAQAARRLVLHDAVDLLSGRIVPPGTEPPAPRITSDARYPRGGLSLDGAA